MSRVADLEATGRYVTELEVAATEQAEPLSPNALRLLLERRSDHHLGGRAPDDAELDLMIQAALQVPDYHYLRPYRFVVIEGVARERFGAMMQEAARWQGQSEAVIARAARMPLRAPMLIVAIFSPKQSERVVQMDQFLCAGSTVLALQLAASALGFGSIWRSGWPMYNRKLAEQLGLDEQESVVGFLYVGQVSKDVPSARPALASSAVMSRLDV